MIFIDRIPQNGGYGFKLFEEKITFFAKSCDLQFLSINLKY